MPLDVILEVLHLVDSPVTQGTLKPGHFVMNEGVFPMPVHSETSFLAHGTLARHTVPLRVCLRNNEVRVTVLNVMADKISDAGKPHLTRVHVALPRPAVVMFHVTHHVAVVTKTLVTSLALERFLQTRNLSGFLVDRIRNRQFGLNSASIFVIYLLHVSMMILNVTQ